MRAWLILAAVAFARVGFGYQLQAVAALGPDLVALFHLSYAAFGSLIGAYLLLGVVLALPLGVLARRFGDRPIFSSGLGFMAVGAVLDACASGPSGIAIGRVVGGIGAVAMTIPLGKIVADFFSGARFMMGMSVVSCAFPIGLGMAQIVLPATARSSGWNTALLTEAVAPAAALLLFLSCYRRPPMAKGEISRFGWPTRRECLLVVIGGAIWTAYTAGYFGYTSYLPSTLAARGESPEMISLVLVVATWGNVPATLLGGGLAARFGALRIFVVASVAVLTGMIGTALAGGALYWAFVVGVVGSIHPGVIMAIGTLSARPENRAVGMGLFYTVYYVGNAITPALCGYAADQAGGPAGGIVAGAILSALTLPLFLLHRRLGSHETMLARP